MFKLYITCPITGLPVSTGMSMLPLEFEKAVTIFRFSSLTCPHCGEIHNYDKSDVVMVADAGSSI